MRNSLKENIDKIILAIKEFKDDIAKKVTEFQIHNKEENKHLKESIDKLNSTVEEIKKDCAKSTNNDNIADSNKTVEENKEDIDKDDTNLGLLRDLQSQFMAVLIGAVTFFAIVPIITNDLYKTLGITLEFAFILLCFIYFLLLICYIFIDLSMFGFIKIGKKESRFDNYITKITNKIPNKDNYKKTWWLKIIIMTILFASILYYGVNMFLDNSFINLPILIISIILFFVTGTITLFTLRAKKLFNNSDSNIINKFDVQELKDNLKRERGHYLIFTILLLLVSLIIFIKYYDCSFSKEEYIKREISEEKDSYDSLNKCKAFSSFKINKKIDNLNSEFHDAYKIIDGRYNNALFSDEFDPTSCSQVIKEKINKLKDSLVENLNDLNLYTRCFVSDSNINTKCYDILIDTFCNSKIKKIDKTKISNFLNELNYKVLPIINYIKRNYCDYSKHFKNSKNKNDTLLIKLDTLIEHLIYYINSKYDSINICQLNKFYYESDNVVKYCDSLKICISKIEKATISNNSYKHSELKDSILYNCYLFYNIVNVIKEKQKLKKYPNPDCIPDFFGTICTNILAQLDSITELLLANSFDTIYLNNFNNQFKDYVISVNDTKELITKEAKDDWKTLLNIIKLNGVILFLSTLLLLFFLWFIIYSRYIWLKYDRIANKKENKKLNNIFMVENGYYIKKYSRFLENIKTYITLVILLLIPIFRPLEEADVNLENPFWTGNKFINSMIDLGNKKDEIKIDSLVNKVTPLDPSLKDDIIKTINTHDKEIRILINKIKCDTIMFDTNYSYRKFKKGNCK